MRQERVLLGLLLALVLLSAGYALGKQQFWPLRAGRATSVGQQTVHLESATDAVRYFYDDISAKRYASAYGRLTNHFRNGQSEETFAAGYATTKSVIADVTPDGVGNVHTVLHAVDQQPGGLERRRTFTGTWALTRNGNKWFLDEGSFTVISDSRPTPEPIKDASSTLVTGNGTTRTAAGGSPIVIDWAAPRCTDGHQLTGVAMASTHGKLSVSILSDGQILGADSGSVTAVAVQPSNGGDCGSVMVYVVDVQGSFARTAALSDGSVEHTTVQETQLLFSSKEEADSAAAAIRCVSMGIACEN